MSTEADIVEKLAARIERQDIVFQTDQDWLTDEDSELICTALRAFPEIAKLRAERDAAARDMRERCAKVADDFIEIVDRQRRPLREKIIAEKLVWDITAAIRALPSTVMATEEQANDPTDSPSDR